MDEITVYAWIGWLVLILIFITIEMLSLEFVFLMLALGSLAGLVVGLFGVTWWAQLLVAAAVSVLLLFTIRPWLHRLLHRGGDPARSNIDALLGTEAVVAVTVTRSGGQAKLANGETWTARLDSSAAPETLGPGSHVQVVSIDGATAVVAPRPGETQRSGGVG